LICKVWWYLDIFETALGFGQLQRDCLDVFFPGNQSNFFIDKGWCLRIGVKCQLDAFDRGQMVLIYHGFDEEMVEERVEGGKKGQKSWRTEGLIRVNPNYMNPSIQSFYVLALQTIRSNTLFCSIYELRHENFNGSNMLAILTK
jgi:hypothetical protein